MNSSFKELSELTELLLDWHFNSAHSLNSFNSSSDKPFTVAKYIFFYGFG